jgi:hypothetical protein
MPRTLSMINFRGDVCGSNVDYGNAIQRAALVNGATGDSSTSAPTIIYTNPVNSGKIAKITFDTVGRTSAYNYDETQDNRGTFPRFNGVGAAVTANSEYPMFMIEPETWTTAISQTGGHYERSIIPVNVVGGSTGQPASGTNYLAAVNETASRLPDDSILIGCPWGDHLQVNSPYMQRTVYIGEGEMLTAMVAGTGVHDSFIWRLHVRALVTEEPI